MDKPFRLVVLERLTDTLKGISSDDGYFNDLADADGKEFVFRGRDQYGPNDPLPLVSILEDPDLGEMLQSENAASDSKTMWPLLIQGFATDDPTHPTDNVYYLTSDVMRKLFEVKCAEPILGFARSGSNILAMTIGDPVCRPADGETSEVSNFYVKVVLTLVEDWSKPLVST